MEEQSLESLVALFLAALAHANHSPQTRRAYATDLAKFCVFYQESVQTITTEMLACRTRHSQHLSAKED